ncbi:MAG: Eco57I restriction-modification methylase domain-containing protein [Clostridiales bacterium]|nr:Eco57I restriction-modification methylase domain-containing protein [Clostridiales bacterium]
MKHEMDDGIERTKRVKSTAEIFTPTDRVEELLDRLNITKKQYQTCKFLDPTCGNGQFLVELAKRGVPLKNIYGVDLMQDNITKVKERLNEYGTDTGGNIEDLNIVRADALTYDYNFGDDWGVKFDYIVGNPPYQNGAKVLYHHMINKFLTLDYNYMSMIIPNRYMVGGKGLDKFRKKMINLKNIKEIIEYPDDFEIFNTVWIRGGVQFITFTKNNNKLVKHVRILHNKIIQSSNRTLNNFDIVIRNIKDEEILNKLETTNKIVIPKISFNIPGHYQDFEEHPFEGCTKLYGQRQVMKHAGTGIKGIGYIKYTSDIPDKYKVITRRATSNNSKRAVNPVFIIEKESICSDTYIVLGLFDELEKAENFCLFMSSKFIRYLVNIRKISVSINSNTFKFVPEMNNCYNDNDLLKKYNLKEYKHLIDSTIVDRNVNHINREQYPREINTWVDRVNWVD